MIVVVLVARTDRYGLPRALGWSLLVVVFLGPIVWPWYETWGIVFLALAADAWSRRVVLVLSAVACFATVPAHVTATDRRLVVAVWAWRRWRRERRSRCTGARRVALARSADRRRAATWSPSGAVGGRRPGRRDPPSELTRCWVRGGRPVDPRGTTLVGLPEGGRIRATHPGSAGPRLGTGYCGPVPSLPGFARPDARFRLPVLADLRQPDSRRPDSLRWCRRAGSPPSRR